MGRKQITKRYEYIDKYVFDAIAKAILKKISEAGKEKKYRSSMKKRRHTGRKPVQPV